jgi:hypothetical protein
MPSQTKSPQPRTAPVQLRNPEQQLQPHEQQALELTADDLRQWRLHPAGKVVFRWLEDLSQHYRNEAMQRWEAGILESDRDPDGLRGRTMMVEELRTLTIDDIHASYGKSSSDEGSE